MSNPASIMDDLNSYAHLALNKNQDNNTINDGMDMTLISLDNKKRELKFAGAYNPMYIVRNGEITIYKVDRFAIGSYKPGEKVFKSTTIPVEKGDMIYLFSDGFQDQFGGPRGKKYMSKNFRNLIVDIAEKSTNQQKELLNQTLENWKAN